ncbi:MULTISPECIES: serine/threonine-protein kinase [unclassified Streptomyces]|uniref:serine/threonine-protein kinase n=1 Tax=unclassified Streptomyces TaxID=2593676 RepID=UPI0033318315
MNATGGELIGGRYRLLELIGQGGMGRVWRGRDETLGREVAVKEVLLPQGVSDADRDQLVQRVLREARASARLNHPGIITVHDVVAHGGAPVIVMEYVTGVSLGTALTRNGPLPVRQAAGMALAMLKALRRAHEAGIVHRDLKPDNVLLMEDRVIITDFGIAHMADATTALTRTGTVMGTPAFMAPEQLLGRPPSPANDLWALGATLYTAVEGEAPFSGETFSALCIAVATQDPRPAVRAGALAPLLAALLTKDPAQRATAELAQAELERLAHGSRSGPVDGPVDAPAPPPASTPTMTVPAAGAPAFVPAPVPVPAPGSAPPMAEPRTAGTPRAAMPAVPPTTAAAAPGPASPGRSSSSPSSASPSRARLIRFGGCFALLLLIGTLLPWNFMEHYLRAFNVPTLLVLILFALGHALPRPRWRPARVLPVLVVADAVLWFFLQRLLALGVRLTDLGTAWNPGLIATNMLIFATGAWLLWWQVPGSRPE